MRMDMSFAKSSLDGADNMPKMWLKMDVLYLIQVRFSSDNTDTGLKKMIF